MISAFGERAKRFARGLGDLDAVISDPENIAVAYLEAAARRERGERFYAMVLADDPRVNLAYIAAPTILANVSDVDQREAAFRSLADGSIAINGRKGSDFWNDRPANHVINEVYLLANAMLVRSYTEYGIIAAALPHAPRPVERVLVEPALPNVVRRRPERPTVVVWGQYRSARELSLHYGGLSGYPAAIVYVAADLTGAPAGMRVMLPDDPALPEILAETGCVVCVEPNDPGAAVAFARQGFGVVATRTSGAHEFVRNVVTWDAGNAIRLLNAVSAAFAQPASVRAADGVLPPAPLAPESPVPAAELPLVSIVIPTYNRPVELRGALGAIGAQTYPNIEVVVVNDCGTPVDDVVAAFPFARRIDNAVNQGGAGAALTGGKAARGDYVMVLPDDDTLYPDHVARIMYAMLRCGAKIAHANGMLRYVDFLADRSIKTTGFNASLLSETLTPTQALIATPVSLNAVIHHRSVFEEAGWWLVDSCLNDLEIHMRQGTRYVFVHVDQITFEFREHAGNQAKKLDFATEARRLYNEVHYAPDRPLLQQHRAATADGFGRRIPGRPAFPATITLT